MFLQKILGLREKNLHVAFFVHKGPTRHFKINFLLFQILLILSVFVFFLAVVFGYFLISFAKENKRLSDNVKYIKSFYINSFFDFYFHKPIPENNEKTNEKNNFFPVATLEERLSLTPVKSDQPQTIQVQKTALSFGHDQFVLSFDLLNTDAGQTQLGSVCAQLEAQGKSLPDADHKVPPKKQILAYPTSFLENQSADFAQVCKTQGEHVKFSRLRPVSVKIPATAGKLHVQKVLIYFVDADTTSLHLLQENTVGQDD